MALPDIWGHKFLLSLESSGGTEIQFAALVDPNTLEVNIGDIPGEPLHNGAGGDIWKESPQEPVEFTIEMFGVDLDNETATQVTGGLFEPFEGGTIDAGEPRETDYDYPAAGVSLTRDRYRLTILWTTDSAATTAQGTTAVSTDSLRFHCDNMRIVSFKPAMDTNGLKQVVTFKAPAMNKAGTAKNYGWESGDQTALTTVDSDFGAFS